MEKVKAVIVEDEVIIAMSLKLMLRNLGFEILDVAATGDAAILCAERERPEVIFMDIFLAGKMNGIEATTKIRGRSACPVVYLTANTDEATKKAAMATEPIAYLQKPVRAEDFAGIHERLVGMRQRPPASPEASSLV
jgi:CheY-like chemotaxis protein